MSHEHYSDRARDIRRGTQDIVETLDEIRAVLTPPENRVGLPELVTAVEAVAGELAGIRVLLVRLLNEWERRADEC